MGDYGAEVILSVYIFNAGLDVVLFVDAEHQTCLVETHLVVAGDFHLHFEFSATCRIEIGGIVDGETIVRDAPIVALRSDLHREAVVFNFPLFRFVEPLHPLQSLGLGEC